MTISEYLSEDHERLEHLLRQAERSQFAGEDYTLFRKGLLRHIGIEEKLLFPILRASGRRLADLDTLRLQHGALAALIIPRPTLAVTRALHAILAVHNAIEEGANGVYVSAEQQFQGDDLLTQAQSMGEVPLGKAIDTLTDMQPVFRALERAGFDPATYFTD